MPFLTFRTSTRSVSGQGHMSAAQLPNNASPSPAPPAPQPAQVGTRPSAPQMLLPPAQRAGLLAMLRGQSGGPAELLQISIGNGGDTYAFHIPLAAILLVQHLCQLARPAPTAQAAASQAAAAAMPGFRTEVAGLAAPAATAPPSPCQPQWSNEPLQPEPALAAAISAASTAAAAAAAAARAPEEPLGREHPGSQARQGHCYVVDVAGPVNLRIHVPATDSARQVLQQLHAVRCGPGLRARGAAPAALAGPAGGAGNT